VVGEAVDVAEAQVHRPGCTVPVVSDVALIGVAGPGMAAALLAVVVMSVVVIGQFLVYQKSGRL
jgi:hypothetical protein